MKKEEQEFTVFIYDNYPEVYQLFTEETTYQEKVQMLANEVKYSVYSRSAAAQKADRGDRGATITQISTKPGSFQVGSIQGDVNITKG